MEIRNGNKAVWHEKGKQLLYATGKTFSNGIITYHQTKSKFFDNVEQARKYARRYLKGKRFIVEEY